MLKSEHDVESALNEKTSDIPTKTLPDHSHELEQQVSMQHSSKMDNTTTAQIKNSSVLVLPFTYTSTDKQSPKVEMTSSSSKDHVKTPLSSVQVSEFQVYETVV